MSIISVKGDLLKQDDVDAIVNTVNCVGVMGKGIALQFKNKWPDNFKAYASACKAGQVCPGKIFTYHLGAIATPKYILNFPTKDHWRGKSHIEFIHDGLADLIKHIRRHKVTSIAIPPLGCGNGGLSWAIVKPLIEEAFHDLPEVEVRLFEPNGSPAPKTMEVNTPPPKMTPGRAAILKLLTIYGELNYGVSRIEIQKLAYFLQESGEDLRLSFVKHHFGPYADQLRHALHRMDGHYIHGVGDGNNEAEITPNDRALVEAEKFINKARNTDLQHHIERVSELIQGFQSPYGMELLATVHWTAKHLNTNSLDEVVTGVHRWNQRKRDNMKFEHIKVAFEHLHRKGWLAPNALQNPRLL